MLVATKDLMSVYVFSVASPNHVSPRRDNAPTYALLCDVRDNHYVLHQIPRLCMLPRIISLLRVSGLVNQHRDILLDCLGQSWQLHLRLCVDQLFLRFPRGLPLSIGERSSSDFGSIHNQ